MRFILLILSICLSTGIQSQEILNGKHLDKENQIVLKSNNNEDQIQPLFLLDGISIEQGAMEKINPDDIESISVVKGDKAIELYGEEGANGVLEITSKGKKIFDDVDVMPRFPGCEDSGFEGKELEKCAFSELINYISSQIKYPESAKKQGVKGKTVVSFVVNTYGRLDNIEIDKKLNDACDGEALRVFKKMNKDGIRWTSGKKDGKAVKVAMKLPITFSI